MRLPLKVVGYAFVRIIDADRRTVAVLNATEGMTAEEAHEHGRALVEAVNAAGAWVRSTKTWATGSAPIGGKL